MSPLRTHAVVPDSQPPALPAHIHVPELSLPRRDARRARVAAASRAVGVTSAVGAVVLFSCGGIDSPRTALVVPLTIVVAGVLAAVEARRAVAQRDVVTDGALAFSRALLFGGLALVLPLTLHAILQTHRWAPDVFVTLADERTFTAWVRTSLVLVGPSHVVFAALAAWRGARAAGRGPRAAALVVAPALAALWTVPLYGVYTLLPMVYVLATALVLVVGLRRLERELARV